MSTAKKKATKRPRKKVAKTPTTGSGSTKTPTTGSGSTKTPTTGSGHGDVFTTGSGSGSSGLRSPALQAHLEAVQAIQAENTELRAIIRFDEALSNGGSIEALLRVGARACSPDYDFMSMARRAFESVAEDRALAGRVNK